MTRTSAREIAIRLGFAAAASGAEPEALMEEFFSEEHYASLAAEDELFRERPGKRQMDYIRRLTGLMAEHRERIDSLIKKYARGWRPERISRTALAVLRCAVCEILYMDDVPNAAAVNEAVELDKAYDDAETAAFVNGVLGGLLRGELDAPDARPAEE